MDIPTVDLSPFFANGDDEGQQKAKDIIKQACCDYGFFQIINHGVPLHLITRSLQLSATFFALPDQEKLKYSTRAAIPLPAGYNKHPSHSPDKYEYLLLFQPESGFNVLPTDPPDFRDVVEELFVYFGKTGQLIEQIVNDCLGLPPDFLKEYNLDRSCDLMSLMRYYPATKTEKTGLPEHKDVNVLTFVVQDEVGGLEVKKDGKWIPVAPAPGRIVVNVGDVIQVLSNDKFKSASHRVMRYDEEKRRHSLTFFYMIEGDKWVEPLPQFTEEIGEAAKYRGFFYKEYKALRMKNKTHPPAKPEDVINISHYAISPQK